MGAPILFVVADDPETLASLAAALERRVGADSRILTDRSPASAGTRLAQARDRGDEIALVVADQWHRPTRRAGDILTGRTVSRDTASAPAWPLNRDPHLLEASVPGVFAAGDVRHRSVKRVTSAVGEGRLPSTPCTSISARGSGLGADS